MDSSTVLLCADDPATRALARISFADASWAVFECTPDEIAAVSGAAPIDLVIVLGTSGAGVAVIRAAVGSAPPVIRVRRPESARDAAALALGRTRRR
jgi:hypothetical protein